MKLYLDDDIVAKLLVRLLIQDGHDVEEPVTAGLSGSDDPVHLAHAVQSGRVFLSANHDDFRLLQNLLMVAGGHHPGILIVRKDNDPRRDLIQTRLKEHPIHGGGLRYTRDELHERR
jgi:hypothetical protein